MIEHVAVSIAARGDADLNEFPALHPTENVADPSGATIRVDGHVRATYPLVPSLAAVPFFWGAIRLGLLDPERPYSIQIEVVGKLAASVWTSLACIALGLLIGKMGATAPAVPFMLAAGLSTPLWSSASQAFGSHAPAACFLALALLWIIDSRLTPSRAVIAGVAFGLAVACRPVLAVFPVGAFLGLLLVAGDHRRSLWLAAGCAVVLVALGIYHLASFGALLGGQASLESAWVHQQTHRVDGAWSGNPFVGLAGILISPSRGILIFAPIVWLVWPAARGAWTNDPFLRWALIVPSLLFVLIWSKYAVWWGGHSYGPRYAADLVVPVVAIIACGWRRLLSTRTRGATVVAVAALVWSIVAQAIGVFCHPNGDWNGSPVDVDHAHARLWDWGDSQMVRSCGAGLYRPRWLR